ncbi:MAG: hypothetical protein M3P53_01360 [Actinomycetota bacterium]|nr:hypothetical protein [Actinomycetota bacterium]
MLDGLGPVDLHAPFPWSEIDPVAALALAPGHRPWEGWSMLGGARE